MAINHSRGFTKRVLQVLAAMTMGLPLGAHDLEQPNTQPDLPPIQHSLGPIRSINNSMQLLAEVNRYRSQHGLVLLSLSETAAEAARLQATYNLANRTHGHANSQYPKPADRLAAAGHSYQPTLEHGKYDREICVRIQRMNSQYVPKIISMIMSAYKDSPAHNEALLDADVRRIGIATVWDGWEIQNTMVLCI